MSSASIIGTLPIFHRHSLYFNDFCLSMTQKSHPFLLIPLTYGLLCLSFLSALGNHPFLCCPGAVSSPSRVGSVRRVLCSNLRHLFAHGGFGVLPHES